MREWWWSPPSFVSGVCYGVKQVEREVNAGAGGGGSSIVHVLLWHECVRKCNTYRRGKWRGVL